MVAFAYLRVFQPIEALSAAERGRVERTLRLPARPPSPRVYRHLTAPSGRLGLLEPTGELPEVRIEAGREYVCPARTRIRVLAAMLSLRDTVAAEVADALVPEAEARRAARELAKMRRREPGAVPTMLESPWHVPVRWFVLFSDEERRMAERPDGGFRVSYWAPIGPARERAQRAAEILESGRLAPVAEMVRDIDEWLACFDEGSAVELDYGSVADGLGWSELDDDHSAREVQEALDALGAGDPDRAGDLYQVVAGRWAEAKIRESLN